MVALARTMATGGSLPSLGFRFEKEEAEIHVSISASGPTPECALWLAPLLV